MRVFILTAGTRGDVQPYIALGRGLREAGHQVTLCTCSSFEPLITSHGLDYGFMSDDFIKLVNSASGRGALEEGGSFTGLIKTMLTLLRESKSITRKMLRDSWDAAREFAPEIIVFHPKAMAGSHIAEKLRIPAVMALPVPAIVPTSEYPAIGFPRLKLGPVYNRLSYRILHRGYHSYDGVVNEFRRETLGIGSCPGSASPISTSAGEPLTVLHGYSSLVWPRPHDWPDTAHVTGYWFLERESGWEPPGELVDFLAAGEPPVFVGFGSMAGRNPRRTTSIIVDALRKAGVRGIIATGWGGLEAGNLPDTVFRIDQAPFDWLFPRVSAVVHHGGAGTTAEGLRAGKPTVICPFLIDQPWWGELVHARGAGPRPIPQKKLTADRLADAIREAVTVPSLRRNAELLGRKIREEDGIARAVEIIESSARGRDPWRER